VCDSLYFIAWIEHYSILAPTQSNKFKKAMEGLSDTNAATRLTDSLPNNKFRTGSGRRNRPQDTEGMLSDL